MEVAAVQQARLSMEIDTCVYATGESGSLLQEFLLQETRTSKALLQKYFSKSVLFSWQFREP